MRILAIRGQNLASLAEEFEVDLASGPLGGAGLFAITGPTGAGKSTLLDALCLALFDRAPRLGGRRESALIGRDELTSIAAHDVRSLVRRGATGGWAEVDFEGGDGRRYRARWSVHRARQKVDGRFRDQQMTLTCVDTGEKLGGTRTETLEAIKAKLGLSFDQFRRSALLAQGDFAAFLRADAAERADLLERMTGTEIYGAVSMAAFQRAKELAAIAKAREDEVARVGVMDELARAASEANARACAAAAGEAIEQLRAVEAAAAWAEARATLVDGVTRAGATLDGSRAALDGGSALRAQVARMEAAEAVRAPWETRAQAREEERRAGAARDAGLDEARRASEALAEAVAVDEAAAMAKREVDAQVGAVGAGVVAPASDARGRRARGAVAAPALRSASEIGETLVRDVARLDDARAWMAANAALGALAADWPRWDKALGRELAAAEAIARARADHERLTAELAAAERRAIEKEAARRGAVEDLEAASAKAEAAEKRRGAPLADLRRKLDAAGKRAEAAARLVDITTAARTAAHDAAGGAARSIEARGRGSAAEAIRKLAEQDAERAAAATAEAERAADQMRRAAGLAHERAALIDGESCALCGAAHHPWAGRGALDELVVEQQQRVATVRAGLRAAETRGLAAAAEARAAFEEADAAIAARDAARAAGARATDAWRTGLAALGELPLVEDPAAAAAAQLAVERAAAAAAARDRAREALAAAEKIDSEASHAQQVALARRADLDHAQDAAAEAAQAVGRTRAQHDAAGRALADGDKAQGAARDELAIVLADWPDWRARLNRERARFAAELERGVTGWRERAAALVAAAAEIATLAAAAAELRLAAERRAAAATAAAAAAADAMARATRAHALAEAALRTALTTAAVGDAPLTEPELTALFAATRHPGDAAAALRARLAELDRAVAEASAVLTERRRLLASHDDARPAIALPDDPIARTAAVTDARAAAQRAGELARDTALALRLDDDARGRRVTAAAALDDARAAALPFEILRDLIGSADGKAFRTFAQGLTLDALLIAANAHLDQLAPRYQLERVPRSDLDLQVVDRDLGDDVRAVQSLSGGESFLVSLALALALSSLSAHDVRVRTLLIDEGFGTLDPASLDVALAALDALQASGRQVGIISHVPGLTERVGAVVAVRPVGSGKSVVRVRAAS